MPPWRAARAAQEHASRREQPSPVSPALSAGRRVSRVPHCRCLHCNTLQPNPSTLSLSCKGSRRLLSTWTVSALGRLVTGGGTAPLRAGGGAGRRKPEAGGRLSGPGRRWESPCTRPAPNTSRETAATSEGFLFVLSFDLAVDAGGAQRHAATAGPQPLLPVGPGIQKEAAHLLRDNGIRQWNKKTSYWEH